MTAPVAERGEKLTKAQAKRLKEIAGYIPNDSRWPHAAYWGGATDRSLVKRGLIERVQHSSKLGGGGAIGGFSVQWNLCRITDAGRAALQHRSGTE